MKLAQNLKWLRKGKAMTQEELALLLGVKRTMISAYEDARSDPKLASLERMVEIFDISMDELLFWDIAEKGRKYLQREKMKILTVTLDVQDKEMISMVGQKAAAGYLNGYSDPEFMENLPQFRLPILSSHRTYRAFEINGDSMLPLLPGMVIIGAYVDHLPEIKNGKTYILVTKNEGVVFKRVFNYMEERGKLYLVSDNELYKPFEISGEEVLEIWEAKAFISTKFPDPKSEDAPVTLEEIARMIVELKSEITKTSKK